jgi:uncharacterized membrane protein YdbT with pleckstrin-like domain
MAVEKRDDIFLLHPSRRVYFIKNYYIVILVVLIAITAQILVLTGYIDPANFSFVSMVLLLAMFLLGISMFHTSLHCKNTFVLLEAYQIVYETGILNSKRKVITFDRITDTALNRTLFDKILGTATLNISTAGSTKYEIRASELKYGPASYIHEKLHEKMRTSSVPRRKS